MHKHPILIHLLNYMLLGAAAFAETIKMPLVGAIKKTPVEGHFFYYSLGAVYILPSQDFHEDNIWKGWIILW